MPDLIRRWGYRLNRACAGVLARAVAWLDRHCDEQAGGWGARMEYKRRYTNPDEAVRARSSPDAKREG